MEELKGHSKQREDFIAWSQKREVSVKHTNVCGEVLLSAEDYKGKAVRINGSTGVAYVVPAEADLLKLLVDNCRDLGAGWVTFNLFGYYKCP